MSRPTRLAFRVPDGASTGLIEVRTPAGAANAAAVRVARKLTDGLHPVTSPAVSRSGMIYATISGPRGKQTPVSVVRMSLDGRGHSFCHRNSECHRAGLQSRRRSLRDLARRGQRLSRGRGRRIHGLRRRHGRGHRRGLRRRRQSVCGRPQRHHLQDQSRSGRSSCTPRWSPAWPPITWP